MKQTPIENRDKVTAELVEYYKTIIVPDGIIYKQGNTVINGVLWLKSNMNILLNNEMPDKFWKLAALRLTEMKEKLSGEDYEIVPMIEKVFEPTPILIEKFKEVKTITPVKVKSTSKTKSIPKPKKEYKVGTIIKLDL